MQHDKNTWQGSSTPWHVTSNPERIKRLPSVFWAAALVPSNTKMATMTRRTSTYLFIFIIWFGAIEIIFSLQIAMLHHNHFITIKMDALSINNDVSSLINRIMQSKSMPPDRCIHCEHYWLISIINDFIMRVKFILGLLFSINVVLRFLVFFLCYSKYMIYVIQRIKN